MPVFSLHPLSEWLVVNNQFDILHFSGQVAILHKPELPPPPEANMAPENGWLEDYVHFGMRLFSEAMFVSGRVRYHHFWGRFSRFLQIFFPQLQTIDPNFLANVTSPLCLLR